jgi:hypothetical protein
LLLENILKEIVEVLEYSRALLIIQGYSQRFLKTMLALLASEEVEEFLWWLARSLMGAGWAPHIIFDLSDGDPSTRHGGVIQVLLVRLHWIPTCLEVEFEFIMVRGSLGSCCRWRPSYICHVRPRFHALVRTQLRIPGHLRLRT